jgi:hypothetical protein
MGDTPYSQAQANLLDSLIDQVNAEPLAFAAHVGDITSGQGPCDDDWLHARKRQFERFRIPFVLLPGDNDWTDCHRSGFDPMERLAKWRQLFCVQVALPGFVRQRGRVTARTRAGNSRTWCSSDSTCKAATTTSAGRPQWMRSTRSACATCLRGSTRAAAPVRQGKTLVVLMQAIRS